MDPISIVKDICVNIFANIATSPKNKQPTPNIIINCPNSNKKEKLNIETSETIELSQRFQRILTLMNGKKRGPKYSISKLSNILGLDKIGDLEKYFNGTHDPTFDFMNKFSKDFGVNPDWLQFNEGYPFESSAPRYTDSMDYFEYITQNNPEAIYFIQSKESEHQSFILLKYSDHKFEVLPRYWHISSHVGNGGSRQIFSFYQFIEKIRKTKFNTKCWGLIIKKKQFWKLYNGEVFPPSILDANNNSFWWDDFTNVDYKYDSREDYIKKYGQEYVYAQSIALNILTAKTKKQYSGKNITGA